MAGKQISEDALSYEAEVQEGGRVEVQVPLPAGTRVSVFVVPPTSEDEDDQAAAADSSIDYWNSLLDEESN